MGITEVDSRGRITIPKEDRERLGIKPGQKIYIFYQNDSIIIKKSKPLDLFQRELRGCIKSKDDNLDPLKIKEMWEPKG